jgi:hypothetical protein
MGSMVSIRYSGSCNRWLWVRSRGSASVATQLENANLMVGVERACEKAAVDTMISSLSSPANYKVARDAPFLAEKTSLLIYGGHQGRRVW